MSRLKRPQASLEHEDTDDDSAGDDTEQGSPEHSRKRLRRTESLSDEDGSSDDESIRGPRSITEAIEDEDEMEFRATQAIQEKNAFMTDEPNVPAEHGILERVECYNFMCHDRFYVELGPLINFIVGKNGSGKSAVLTAITLCLGGKASATNRGQSLKSFIKEGKETSTIIVRIRNQGDGAYLPDDYGKSVVVERHFSKNGTSGFKLKSDSGRIVSTKKSELYSIIDFFCLQFDNPLNVLSQDMARQFLSTSSPPEKYKLFVKGVQLEQLDNDYKLIEENVDQSEEKLRSRNEEIEILRREKEAAQKKLEISDQQGSLRDRVRKVRSKMAWAQVEEQERMRDALSDDLARADEQIAAAEADLGRYDEAFQGAEVEAETAAECVRQAASRVEQAQNDLDNSKTKLDEQMAERHDLQSQQRTIREHVKAAQSRIDETQQKISEENQRLADLSGGSYTRKQEEFEQAKIDLEDTRRRHGEHQQELPRLIQEAEAAEEGVRSANTPIGKKKADFQQAESVLRNLQKEGGSRPSGFHDRMPSLLRAIQQERSFSRRPVGPIGHHVSLLKPKWSSILENSLGTTLNSFIVTSKKDSNILSNIMQRVNCHCPIFIGSDGYIDTSQHEPDPQFDTALRVLEIDNDLVRRQLIINHGIEQMLLIENLEEATSTLFDGQRPRNVKRCYCIDRADRRRGIHLSYSRTGEPSQAPVPAYKGNPRMKSDLASQIRNQRDVVEDLRRGLNEQEQLLRSAQVHLERCKQARTRHQRESRDLQISIQRKEDHVEELNDVLERENVEDGVLDVLRETLREAQQEKELNEGSYNDSIEAMKNAMRGLKDVNREIDTKSAHLRTLQQELIVAQHEQRRVQSKRQEILSDKAAAGRQIEENKNARERTYQEREHMAGQVREYVEKANLVSPRMALAPTETTASLDKKLDKLQEDIKRYDQELGSTREEIAADFHKKLQKWKAAKRSIKELIQLTDVFKDTLRYRKQRWDLFRSHISSRAKAQFTYLLSERSFRGRLLADHTGKLLDLQVEPDATKDSAGRGARTLSGGEKSFSQVCLLLALWEAMGSPIRCLDEFDVYMDSVNRKMAIDMLMIAARRSVGRQFILITPGSRSEISLAPDVRVKELAEPERGQTSLPF